MSIQDDFDAQTAASILQELDRFRDECWYDPALKRIVYRTDEAALRAYLTLQWEEMERHKWIESEKARRDLEGESLADWVNHHSIAISRYWHHTHLYIPSGNNKPVP